MNKMKNGIVYVVDPIEEDVYRIILKDGSPVEVYGKVSRKKEIKWRVTPYVMDALQRGFGISDRQYEMYDPGLGIVACGLIVNNTHGISYNEKEYAELQAKGLKAGYPKATSVLEEKCLGIATRAHAGQYDISGDPVILHPIAVGTMGNTPFEVCSGFLHDVVEDCDDWTFGRLRDEGVPDMIIDALKLLTHEKDTDYLEYIRNIINSGNRIAVNVKINDLRHNLKRVRAKGFDRLVEKHTAAMREFIKAGLADESEIHWIPV